MPTPQYEDVYEPPMLDSTGQAILQAIQALSAPSGTDVAISPTGMHIVTEDDVQGAISELDSAVDSVNSSLTQLIKRGTHQTAISQNGSFNIGTYIPNWSNSKLIIVNFRRYGNVSSAIIATDIVNQGNASNAIYFYYASAPNYFTIATDGTLTMKTAIQDAVYTDITCIF